MVLFSVCDCVRFRLILFCPWCPVLGENGSVRVIVFCSVRFCSVRGALFCPWCCFLSVVLCTVRGALCCPWCSVLSVVHFSVRGALCCSAVPRWAIRVLELVEQCILVIFSVFLCFLCSAVFFSAL